MPRRLIRRFSRRAAIAALVVIPASLLAFWLALEHKPNWYAPPILADMDVPSARRDATNAVDRFGDQLVLRAPFEVVLRDDAVNAWLSALPQIWPEAAHALPPEVHGPALRFELGRLRGAALFEVAGWRAILSAAITVHLCEDGQAIEWRLEDVRCGVVPVPRRLVARLVNPLIRDTASSGANNRPAHPPSDADIESFHEIRSVAQLYDGVRIANRFVWPNGKRPFRIDRITVTSGELRLLIAPLYKKTWRSTP